MKLNKHIKTKYKKVQTFKDIGKSMRHVICLDPSIEKFMKKHQEKRASISEDVLLNSKQ